MYLSAEMKKLHRYERNVGKLLQQRERKKTEWKGLHTGKNGKDWIHWHSFVRDYCALFIFPEIRKKSVLRSFCTCKRKIYIKQINLFVKSFLSCIFFLPYSFSRGLVSFAHLFIIRVCVRFTAYWILNLFTRQKKRIFIADDKFSWHLWRCMCSAQ